MREWMRKLNPLVTTGLVLLLFTVGCGKKNEEQPQQQPPPQQPPPQQQGGFGGGGGACGNIGQTTQQFGNQPLQIQVGNTNQLTLNLSYVDTVVQGADRYRIVGSGEFFFEDLRQAFPNQQNTQLCLASSSVSGQQPLIGYYYPFRGGQIVLRLNGTIQAQYNPPVGSPYGVPGGQQLPQGPLTVTMDVGTECFAAIRNGAIEGCARVTLGTNGPSQPYQLSGGIGFNGGIPQGPGFGGNPGGFPYGGGGGGIDPFLSADPYYGSY